jgi:uncharacterized protein YndB with AHSA1/START domain
MASISQRFWLTADSVTVTVQAPPERVFDLVADLPRMGDWSPECTGGQWLDGATGAVPGARFAGRNRTGPRGMLRWSRTARVLLADRGRELAFATEHGGRREVLWRYRLEPTPAGTRVTESYEVLSIPTWARLLNALQNRHAKLLANMAHTLSRLKAAAEAAAPRASIR